MGIDHRGTDIPMTDKFPDGLDIIAVFQQMGRK